MQAWALVGVGRAEFPKVDGEGSEDTGGKSFISDVDTPIPDNDKNGIEDVIVMNERVRSFSVMVDIEHPYRGDLIVRLISPQSTVYFLHRKEGKDKDDLRKIFPVTINNGENSIGSWTIRVSDHHHNDEGVFHRWSISW